MKTEQVINKDNEVLKTKEGVELQKHTFEVGDLFIPKHNNVIEKRKTAMVKGKEKIITEFSTIAKVSNNGLEYINRDNVNEFFISLTPSQAKTLKSKIDAGIEINQNKFVCYEYVNDYGPQIGVGLKRNEKPAIGFRDGDEVKEE